MDWLLELHDTSGELARYVLSDPQSVGATEPVAGPVEPVSVGDLNRWHRVAVLGRPLTLDGERYDCGIHAGATAVEHGGTPYVNGGIERREPGVANVNGVSGPVNADASANKSAFCWDSDSSVFEVRFEEGGRTAVLDLSLFSIRWIAFSRRQQEGVDSAAGDESPDIPSKDSRMRSTGNIGGSYSEPCRPPGFVSLEDLSGPLANSQADVGMRVDVWWPRYNSYFRATVRVEC